MPTSLDSDGMEDLKNSEETWAVDFWAEWCGPCQKLSPRFEEVSEEVDGINFGKVDMEEHQQLGAENGVRALPTIVIFRDGEEVDRKSGLMSKDELKEWIQGYA